MLRSTISIVAALSAAAATAFIPAPAQAPAASPSLQPATRQGTPPIVPAQAPAPQIDTSGMADTLPPIKVTPESLDLGFMAPKASGKGTVMLTNTGLKPLTIAAITPSCKCTTTSQLAGTVIEPGMSVPLEAVLEGASMPQTHRASIRVLVDGYAKVLEIQLHGETALPVRAVPSLINAVEGKPRQGRFVIESIDKKPFNICAIGGRVPDYIGYTPGEGARATYLVRYDLDSWQPTFPAYLIVETDRADCPIFDVWVRSENTIPTAALRMKEYRVNAGRIPMGGSVDVAVEMDDAGEEILAVESVSPELQVEMLGQKVEGKNRKVVMRATPKGPQQGLIYGQIKLYTREKEQPLVIFGSVRASDAKGCEGCRADKVTPGTSATTTPEKKPMPVPPQRPTASAPAAAPASGAPPVAR